MDPTGAPRPFKTLLEPKRPRFETKSIQNYGALRTPYGSLRTPYGPLMEPHGQLPPLAAAMLYKGCPVGGRALSAATTKYVEVVVVNDKTRYDSFGGQSGLDALAAQGVTCRAQK